MAWGIGAWGAGEWGGFVVVPSTGSLTLAGVAPNSVLDTRITPAVGSLSLAGVAPTVVFDPPIGNKVLKNLGDGIWYYNIRFKNASGWGAITHFKIQIDTVAPNPFRIIKFLS